MNKLNELHGYNDWLFKTIAAFVFLFALVIYTLTKAPTLSFWDCGEFIACSYILGIPHPPGAPLYIIIAHIFSIIPMVADISARINMFSAVSGGFATLFAFLITFRLIRWWWPTREFLGWKKAAAYIGSIVGSSLFAFGRTNWGNAGEAEVYMPAMLLMMIIIWLLLIWIEKRQEETSDRYLHLITYLAFLSIGIHLTTFLIMPAVFLAVLLFSDRLRKDVRFYITGFVLLLIANTFISFIIAAGIWLIVAVIMVFVRPDRMWKLALGLTLAATIGLSCQAFTPIRSAQQPNINQNNPSASFKAFNNFLERRQYGEQNMLVRALERRGRLANQFGNHPRMGFWRFFSEQYGVTGRSFAFIFVLGLLGLYELLRRKPKFGWPFFLMILLGTVVLVWYMNFADGTKQDPLTGEGHIEVRDRDYFFTPGFILFGISIGLGVAGLMEMMRESIFQKIKALKTPSMILVSALIVLAAAPIRANYYVSDRSGNFIPYDFAKNYLDSCDPNSILFIGGDNDTFPLWCLQEVYDYRRDVSVINLALSNLDWYIKQIRDKMGVPIRWTDGQIDALRGKMYSGGKLIRIQDQVLDEILNVNQWEKPIHFAITIPENMRQYNGRSIQSNLIMQGMVYRLEPGQIVGDIDIEKMRDLYFNTFSFRSIADSAVYKDERTRVLTGNYTTGLQLMADSLRRAKQFDEAIRLTKKAIEIVPYEYSSYNYLTQLYVEAGRADSIPLLLAEAPAGTIQDMHFVWAMAYKYIGDTVTARERLKIAFEKYPHFNDVFREYSRILYEEKRFADLKAVIETWIANNPGDEEARLMLESLNKMYRPPVPTP